MANDTPRETTQALATRTPQVEVITSADQYARQVSSWHQSHFHVLSPVTDIAALPPDFTILPTKVLADPDPRNKEVYVDRLFCGDDEVALAKPLLSKIAQAMGINITTERTDPRTVQHYWEVRATASWTGLDGTTKVVTDMADYDLRDGAPRVTKMIRAAQRRKADASNQIEGARMFGLRGCEARAINAVIRQICGLRQTYRQEELRRPFICLQLMWTPDMSNPVVAQAVANARLGATSLLYGSSQPRALPSSTPEVLDTIGADAPAALTAATGIETPTPRAAAPAREVLAVEHDLEAGRYTIRLDGGEIVLTSSAEVANALLDAKKTKRRVTVDVDEDMAELRGFQIIETPPAAATTPATSAARSTTPAPPPAEGAVVARVHDVQDVRNGKRPDGSTWTLRKLVTEAGDWFTFSDTHARVALEAKTKGWPVRLTRAPENSRYPDQLDVDEITLIDPRQGSLLGDNL